MRKTSPRTTSTAGEWRQLRHLLADDPHLLAIALIGGYASNLLADRGARSPPSGCLAESGAHRHRVCQALGANHVEGGCGGLV
jgi:hypothetical protein